MRIMYRRSTGHDISIGLLACSARSAQCLLTAAYVHEISFLSFDGVVSPYTRTYVARAKHQHIALQTALHWGHQVWHGQVSDGL